MERLTLVGSTSCICAYKTFISLPRMPDRTIHTHTHTHTSLFCTGNAMLQWISQHHYLKYDVSYACWQIVNRHRI